MLAFFRTLAKSRIAAVIIGIPLLLGLLVIGNVRADLGNLFSRDAVIIAGSRTYSAAEFKREFDAFRQEAQQQGQTLSPEDAVAQGLDQRMLQGFSERESTSELFRRAGIVPADRLVVDQIAKVKAFFDPITGKFDQKTYVARLAENNMTPGIFERGLRDEVAYNQFAAAAAAGLRLPRLFGAMVSDFEFESHNLSLVALDPKVLGAPPVPTDAQLEAILKANTNALMAPEMRTLTVVRFSAKDQAPAAVADPTEVRKRYDFRKDTLSKAETRTVVQIPAKTPQDAAAIAAKLNQGQDPKAVAKAAGVEPVVYTDTPKAGVADPKVADAAFALPEGKVSAPIQGQLGLAVVKVLKVTPGHAVSFEEARPGIEAEVKTEAAADKIYAIVQKYQDAHEKGSTLAEAAHVAGVTAVSMGPVTATGADDSGKPMNLSPRLLKEAFALSQGGETDAIQESKGEYFAVRVDKVIPPSVPPLARIHDKLSQFFVQSAMNERLTAKLGELSARVKKGETLDAVAASIGSKVVKLSITRAQAQQNKSLSPEQINQIFQARPGELVTAGAVLARVDSIQPPSSLIAAASVSGGQMQMARPIFDELTQEARVYARTVIKPKVNLAMARQAIGVAPEQAPKSLALPGSSKAQ
jgi:peptidyl-prolyl cis-trans isomerase D